jgi:hypothetical protein
VRGPAPGRYAVLGAILACCGLGGGVHGCVSLGANEPTPPYVPERRDYLDFRARAGVELLEPNYLPFMVHRIPAESGDGDDLIVCHWPVERMPLSVFVTPPEIPEELQNEFDPRESESYVRAVEEALESWEDELEGLVRFRSVAEPDEADLHFVLLGEVAPAPEPDLQVLGLTPVARACRVRFEVPSVRIYIADRFGLLVPDQVQWIALHEIGHALGMRQHSPIPADLMYEVVRDRMLVRGPSVEDANSFVSLYRLPNGTVFGHLPAGEPTPRQPVEPPTGPPRLAMAPYVDPRLGFAFRPPAGWMRFETDRGVVAIDGVTWDYTASFQVIVQRYATIEEYLQRYGSYYLSQGLVQNNEYAIVAGRRALVAWLEDPVARRAERLTFIETGDGRLIVVIADCPIDLARTYAPWFDATLVSLEIWTEPGRSGRSGRDGASRGGEDQYNAPREESR